MALGISPVPALLYVGGSILARFRNNIVACRSSYFLASNRQRRIEFARIQNLDATNIKGTMRWPHTKV
jgi:hypothetical protein